ncbi:AAA family ATPase [Actinokineospora sp. G85]|uniref:AAA family ATPase n=1 Tax=Actinokineospora sp. G85 TaxID=3406626 RepID=UPI003C72BD9D
MRFRHALVLGKFYPPHAGHHHLIRAAAAESERTTVAMLGATVESLSIRDRVSWLAEEHATDHGVRVIGDLDDHPIDYHDPVVWDLHMGVVRSVLARRAALDGHEPVDAVFSSEDYGVELARRLGARHVPVDPGRVAHPVSGTAVRADVRGNWSRLARSTRAGLCTRVVVLGAESSGTTTLARALAAHYGGDSVPEYGREHTEVKARAGSTVWTVGDFVDVAVRQAADEDAAAPLAPVLVCDNDPWAATVWCERYLGAGHPEVDAAVGTRRPALYLLTDHVGVPFEQDGTRDGEHLRPWMTARFVRGLRERGVPWVLLTGNHEHRLRRAIRACEEAMTTRFTFAPPL